MRKAARVQQVPLRCRNHSGDGALLGRSSKVLQMLKARCAVGFGKGLLLWIIGIPLPIILLLALFWR
jgi:hypothetical protein